MNWLSGTTMRRLLLVLLVGAALLSVLRGVQNAHRTSQDFQWSGARMLLDHIDPWQDRMDGDPLHRILLTQNPNYLPLLYVLLAPLAPLPPVPAQDIWAGCNVVFALISGWLAARFFGFGRFGAIAIICMLLSSTPARLTIGNGQQGLLVLLFWCIGLLGLRAVDERTGAHAALTGFSYVKYNFAPPVAIYLWLRAGLRAVAFSLLPAVTGTLIVWLWLTHGSRPAYLGWLTIAPLQVSRWSYFPYSGGSNLMDILELPLYAHHFSYGMVTAITMAVALAICFTVLYRVTRGSAPSSFESHMALLGLLSFGLFKHHSYDGVVLLLPLCYLLRLRAHRPAQVALALLAYVGYAERVVDQILPRLAPWAFIPEFCMLMAVTGIILRLCRVEAAVFPAQPASGPLPAPPIL